jgi:hypothetical protein
LTDTLSMFMRGLVVPPRNWRWKKMRSVTGPLTLGVKRPQICVRLISPGAGVAVYEPNAKRATSTLLTSTQMVPMSALATVGAAGRDPLASQRNS